MQLNLFTPPVILRPAPLIAGVVFHYGGRALRIHRVYGTDPRAPVILEDLASRGSISKGQYALWSAAAVTRAISGAQSWPK